MALRLALLAGLAISAVGAAAALATTPGTNGQIAFRGYTLPNQDGGVVRHEP